MTPPPLIYLIAGEPSGDRLGASLIGALRRAYPEIEVTGLGGREMTQAGLTSLFDTDELAVMGIAEVLPRLPQLLRRIRETSEDVLTRKPAALVTIDSPSFGLRVSERVRRRDPSIPTIHYVAPSVWAWRPGRARHMARFTDQVLALLPFEPPYMEAAGMTCDFVGHPIAQRPSPTRGEVLAARRRWGLEEGTPTLLVAPGSRKSEVARLSPLFREVVTRAKAKIGGLRVLVPVVETVAPEVRSAFADFPGDPVLIRPDWGEPAKLAAFAVADAALLASGTV
ncbi:MAG: lipid-A-disaccharide synthase, partial [Pseudomonadota bacterium]